MKIGKIPEPVQALSGDLRGGPYLHFDTEDHPFYRPDNIKDVVCRAVEEHHGACSKTQRMQEIPNKESERPFAYLLPFPAEEMKYTDIEHHSLI